MFNIYSNTTKFQTYVYAYEYWINKVCVCLSTRRKTSINIILKWLAEAVHEYLPWGYISLKSKVHSLFVGRDKHPHSFSHKISYCLSVFFFPFFPQKKPWCTELVRLLDQSQQDPLDAWPTTFQASTKHLLWCSLFLLIITGTKIGGIWSCTMETQGPTMISTRICTMTQTPSGQMVGMRETSVLVSSIAALCPALVPLPWRFMLLQIEQLAYKPSMLALLARITGFKE